jgi:hypothetical protein
VARDGYTAVSAFLGATEAEMLRGVLESAGIEVVVEGEAIASLALPQALAAATVLVPDADAQRAREIVSASGVFPGALPERDADIDEAEWRAGAPDVADVEPAPPAAPELARRALWAAAVALPLCFTLLVPLYAMAAAARFYRGAKGAPRGAHLRAACAVVVSAVSLSLGVAFWAKVAPDLARRETRTIWIRGKPVRVPEAPQRPRPPFP